MCEKQQEKDMQNEVVNITDGLVPFFEGKVCWDSAVAKTVEWFVKKYAEETFACELCGEIVFPKLTTNDHGIYIHKRDPEQCICNQCSDEILFGKAFRQEEIWDDL